MGRFRRRESDEDRATRATRGKEYADFLNVENRRSEPFPEEFPEGPYGGPVLEQIYPPYPPGNRGGPKPPEQISVGGGQDRGKGR